MGKTDVRANASGGWRYYGLPYMLLCVCVSILFLHWQEATPQLTHPSPAAPSTSTSSTSAPSPSGIVSVVSASGHRFTHIPHDPLALPLLRWGIMFDAGSTGSRVHIYRFRVPEEEEGGEEMGAEEVAQGQGHDRHAQPVLEDEIFAEVKPGLSAFMPMGVGADPATRDVGAPTAVTVPVPDLCNTSEQGSDAAGALALSGPRAAAESLRPLLELCMEQIPASAHSSSPISLRATAGLRLLGVEASEEILREIRSLFALYPFPFRTATGSGTAVATGEGSGAGEDVAVMDGSEEGVFAWLTVNYLAQRLQDYKSDDAEASSLDSLSEQLTHHHPKTSAILDLGGASTQIVFEPEFSSWRSLTPEQQALLYKLPYGSNAYYLFQRSYLGFGLMEARRKIKESLLAHPGLQVHPMHREGIELATHTAEGVPIKYHPCLSDAHEEVISVPAALTDPPGTPEQTVLLRGYAQGHASCAALARTLFEKDAPCHLPGPCSFGGHFALPITEHFGLGSSASSSAGSSLGAGGHVYAFSYFYDRTLELLELDECKEEEADPSAAEKHLFEHEGHAHAHAQTKEQAQAQHVHDHVHGPEDDGSRSGTILRISRLRALADQVCAFSPTLQGVRSLRAIEAEKEAARVALERLEGAVQARREAGCRTVTVRQKDGSTTTMVLTQEDAGADAAAASVGVEDASAAAAAAFVSTPVPDEGACMVEEQPDLSEAAEAAHAHVPSPLAGIIDSNPYLCLDLTYLHTLLHYGYDMPESVELHVFKRLQRKEIGWCLGAMLAQMAQRGW